MSQFILILRDDPSQYDHLSPAEMQAVIELLEGGIDEAAMRRLNRLVDDELQPVGSVVSEFLAERGWVEP